MTWAAVGIAGATLVGGYISSQGAQNAASSQAAAAENAQQISMNEFNTITGQEQPFMQAGYGAQNELNYLMGIGMPSQYTMASGKTGTIPYSTSAGNFGSLLQPFTVANWQQLSPAYNFQREQGMQGVLGGDAASSGALSGAAQKDLMSFNQNLANTSFNNAFNMYQTQQGNIYQRLAGVAQLGQAAASNTGQQGTALAGQAAQSATNIGTAIAGGQVGAANAWSSALTGAAYTPWLFGGQGGNSNWGGTPSSPGFTGAPLISDMRLKTNVKPIGKTDSGLTVYTYHLKGDPSIQMGVMAQEVLFVNPEAVSMGEDGYYRVDYGKIT